MPILQQFVRLAVRNHRVHARIQEKYLRRASRSRITALDRLHRGGNIPQKVIMFPLFFCKITEYSVRLFRIMLTQTNPPFFQNTTRSARLADRSNTVP